MSRTITLPNSGAVVPSTGSPEYGGGGTDFALLCLAIAAVDNVRGNVQHITAAGAVTITNGKVFLNTGAASAITLPTPVAGPPSVGGNDGQELQFVALDGFAYVVSTAANIINGNKLHATFAGVIGDSFIATAYGGLWYVAETSLGVTLS